jgi:hypothetical protein
MEPTEIHIEGTLEIHLRAMDLLRGPWTFKGGLMDLNRGTIDHLRAHGANGP